MDCVSLHVPLAQVSIDHTRRQWINNTDLMLIKIQPDATVRRYLFTAKSLHMFRVSQHPSSGVLKTVTPASGTGRILKYKD